MNWKTVRHLIGVELKAGRMLRGKRLIRYNTGRNRFFTYLEYGAAIAIGLAVGILIGYFYNTAFPADIQSLFITAFANFQVSLPTLILIVTLVLTMMQQFQRSGTNFKSQAPYWLPVTWQEHTIASIFSDVLGIPLVLIVAIAPAIVAIAAFTGQLPLALGASFAMCGAAFTAGATTEVFRILQVRFTGAVYKSSGKAAIWVRFASTLIFFVLFYIVYSYVIYGTGLANAVQAVASVQSAAWFVPFVWVGVTLSYFTSGLFLYGAVFLMLSLLFIFGLFYLCVSLNTRFGLYEPPAITVSSGIYAPKTGVLGKLGFAPVESALIRKDLKAFTRRRELISAFILPIVIIIIPIVSSLNTSQSGGAVSGIPPQFGFAFTSLFPAGVMAMMLGNFMTGEEGQSVWRIYFSPISAKNFLKSKYAFMLFFALIILPITSLVGFFVYHPTPHTLFTLTIESVFMVFAIGALSLANGIKGADFNEVPRPRMIRAEWSIINLITCAAAGLAVLAPLIPNVLTAVAGTQFTFLPLYQAIIVSGVIAAVLTVIFYQVALSNAKELLTKAQV
jgi:hypothetical protein